MLGLFEMLADVGGRSSVMFSDPEFELSLGLLNVRGRAIGALNPVDSPADLALTNSIFGVYQLRSDAVERPQVYGHPSLSDGSGLGISNLSHIRKSDVAPLLGLLGVAWNSLGFGAVGYFPS